MLKAIKLILKANNNDILENGDKVNKMARNLFKFKNLKKKRFKNSIYI